MQHTLIQEGSACTCEKGIYQRVKLPQNTKQQAYLFCSRFPLCRITHVIEDASIKTLGDLSSAVTVVFDTETTGTSKTDKIIEIGAVKAQHGVIIDTFHAMIDPQFFISPMITRLTGIENRDLLGKPKEDEVIPKFMAWLEGVDVLVAHNIAFDKNMLNQTCKRLKLPFYHGLSCCTLQASRKLYPARASHKLGDLCEFFGISLENAHRAHEDAKATYHLLMKLANHQGAKTVALKPFSE